MDNHRNSRVVLDKLFCKDITDTVMEYYGDVKYVWQRNLMKEVHRDIVNLGDKMIPDFWWETYVMNEIPLRGQAQGINEGKNIKYAIESFLSSCIDEQRLRFHYCLEDLKDKLARVCSCCKCKIRVEDLEGYKTCWNCRYNQKIKYTFGRIKKIFKKETDKHSERFSISYRSSTRDRVLACVSTIIQMNVEYIIKNDLECIAFHMYNYKEGNCVIVECVYA